MDLENALNQLSDIRSHLFKAEVFHGFKAIPLAFSGLGAFLAAALQPLWVEKGWALGFVMYWSVVAILTFMVFAGSLFYNYYRNNEVERRVTRQIVLQFSPSIVVGGLLAVMACFFDGQAPYFMPGLWCVILALGIFSSRPYLPPNIMFVGGYYIMAGLALFLCIRSGYSFSPWGMGLAFGIGQILAALIFYLDLNGSLYMTSDQPNSGRFAYHGLDRIIHERSRLGILTSLITRPDGIVFTDLKSLCALTDGNLSRHIKALEEEGLVEVWKRFKKNRPQTLCRLTQEGRLRFHSYIDELERVIKDASIQSRQNDELPGFSPA